MVIATKLFTCRRIAEEGANKVLGPFRCLKTGIKAFLEHHCLATPVLTTHRERPASFVPEEGLDQGEVPGNLMEGAREEDRTFHSCSGQPYSIAVTVGRLDGLLGVKPIMKRRSADSANTSVAVRLVGLPTPRQNEPPRQDVGCVWPLPRLPLERVGVADRHYGRVRSL